MRAALPGLGLSVLAVGGACEPAPEGTTVVTFPSSAVGREAELLTHQIARFERQQSGVRVALRRTPDAADQRHQLYVQWLNAQASQPDVLQLDVVWTPEFAAAGWLLPLDRFAPPVDAFFPATVAANRWREELYALPWFADVGMLYYRTDLVARAPASLAELAEQALRVQQAGQARYGLVWQGARYEGLVCVFLEYLGASGGCILDQDGRVQVDAPPAVAALDFMVDAVRGRRFVPAAALTWQEEQTRFAFQNGDAAFLRNWPYAHPLLQDPAASKVAGKVGVAPMPAAAGGAPTATLGGSQLAINAHSAHPDAAWAVIRFLTAPEQMLERAVVLGQLPPRPALFDAPELKSRLGIPAADARAILARATPRPVSPVYTELSEALQIWLHEALTGQTTAAAALGAAAGRMRAILKRSGLRF